MEPGTRVGPYEIIARLGAGGMGEVYRARDAKLGRDVAIKVLPSTLAADADLMARFEREARLLATLNHPNIGAIYGLETFGTGASALILELIEGPTLAEHLHVMPRGAARLRDALNIARQIADALDAAHERGIVHRDLKPANIKITPDGVVKVLDFGLAKSQADAPESDLSNSPTMTVHATEAGVILGTAAYMSPEQARGRPVDKRTDIWSFGCVLYEMLTGTRAFQGETTSDLIAAILETQPDLSRLPSNLPPGVRRLVQRCLEKDKRKRLRDIADLRADLDDELSGNATPASAPRRGAAPWLLAAAVGLAVIGPIVAWTTAQRSVPAPLPSFDHVARIVATAAHEYAPVLSPDGKWIAYLSNARGPTDVWVKFIAGGDPANLTATSGLTVQSTDYVSGLDISPDGTQIAFTVVESLSRASSWVIPAPLGGVPRRVLPDGNYGMDWSPDGTHIVFVRAGGPLGDALILADADGQNEKVLVERQGARHVHWPRWSGDGRYVYFNYGPQNFNIEPTGIARVAAGGGAIEPVITTARRAAYPVTNREGTGLIYAANPDTADLNLWWRDLRTGRDTRLTSGIGEYTHPAVSADGRTIVGTVFDSPRQSLQRVLVQFDKKVQIEPVTDGHSGDFDPVWSPDGTRLVFSSSRTGNRNLWVMAGNSTPPAPLTSGTSIDERPAISPDGRTIAFVSDRSGHRAVWMMSADGGAPRLVITADVVDTISWSPDSTRLVYATPIGNAPGLVVLDVATATATPLKTPAAATGPAWSRDDIIAFIEPRGGTIGAFAQLIRPDGQPVKSSPLDAPGAPQVANGSLVWSPDGKRIAAASLPGAAAGTLWIIDPFSATPYRKLLDLPAGIFSRGLSWSRDGTSLTFGTYQWSGDIFLANRSAGR